MQRSCLTRGYKKSFSRYTSVCMYAHLTQNMRKWENGKQNEDFFCNVKMERIVLGTMALLKNVTLLRGNFYCPSPISCSRNECISRLRLDWRQTKLLIFYDTSRDSFRTELSHIKWENTAEVLWPGGIVSDIAWLDPVIAMISSKTDINSDPLNVVKWHKRFS